MSTASISRNALCPCGSGQKYKRCCRTLEERIIREAAACDLVGRRIQSWSMRQFDDEVRFALDRYVGPERVMGDDDLSLFSLWFHNDRELPGGRTPAELYAARVDLPASEREMASRIAGARLGLYRVLSTEPGRSLLLEGVVGRGRVEVASQLVSRTAIRWDIVLAHVMDGDPPSLWGPARFFEPCDEPELLAELQRHAGMPVEQLDGARAAQAYRRHAFELLRYTTERSRAKRSYFTLEGDALVFASATWQVHDLAAATARLRELGGLSPEDAAELEITVPRASLVAQRSELPPGALIIESGPVDAPETAPIASLRIERGRLHAEAMSEARLEHAIEIVTADFGDLVELVESNVTPANDALHHEPTRRVSRQAQQDSLDADDRHVLERFVGARMHRWLDEPHPALDGRTPREAQTSGDRAEVAGLIRQLENGAERSRRRGEPAADIAALRRQLDLSEESAA